MADRRCGIDPGERTGMALIWVAGDKPTYLNSATWHPASGAKWSRLRRLEDAVYAQLVAWEPEAIIMEGARRYPHKRSSTVSTIGQGENRGAVLCAVGHYEVEYPCRVVMADAPDQRQGRGRRATKGRARLSCQAWFGLDVTAKMGDDEVDAAVLAVVGGRDL